MLDFYGINVGKYTSPMDGLGDNAAMSEDDEVTYCWKKNPATLWMPQMYAFLYQVSYALFGHGRWCRICENSTVFL